MRWRVLLVCLLIGGCCENTSREVGGKAHPAICDVDRNDSLRQADLTRLFSYDQRAGKRLFDHYCVVCHGALGEGDGFNAYNLDPRPVSFRDSAAMVLRSDLQLLRIVQYGGKAAGKSPQMHAYRFTLTEVQTNRIVTYLRTFSQGDAVP